MKNKQHYYLIYLSRCEKQIKKHEILTILSKSYQNNEQNNLTSMLIHRSGQFLQIIEGDEDRVQSVYQSIQSDSRHFDLCTIDEGYKTEHYCYEFMGIRYSSSTHSHAFKDWFEEGFNASIMKKYKTLTQYFLRMMARSKPDDIQAKEYEHYRLLG